MNRYGDELEFAVRLVRAAGTLILESYGRVGRVRHKSRRDVVTDIDYRSEALIAKRIKRRFPDDGILAEEAGPDRVGGPDGARRWWAVDPLDGTVNYANGIPYFCVSVALIEDLVPVLGVVFDPLRGDLYTATAQGAARLNGSLAKASSKDAIGDYVVSLAILGRGGLARERKIAPEIRIHRRMGSAALSLASVGAGRFDAFIQNGGLSRWDVAAAGLIAERGGATVTNLTGGPWWQPKRRRRGPEHRGRAGASPRRDPPPPSRGGHPGPGSPPLMLFRQPVLAVVVLATAFVTGCVASAPGTSSTPTLAESAAQGEFPSECPPIDLRGPDGARVDLTGEWAGSGVLAQDNEIALLNQIGECVFGSVSGYDSDGAQAVTNLTGRLHPDFTMDVEIAIVLQTAIFRFGELSAMVMVVEWDEEGRLRLREVREQGGHADRCVIANFDCPAPVIWYRTDESP